MSGPLATYSFLPWLRQGLATRVTGAVGARATIAVELELVGDKLEGGERVEPKGPSAIALYGPGDVIGVERRAIVRTEPQPLITNFEPNYVPFVEFYDEDFPWRFTPAAPFDQERRLRPWLTLAVLEPSEFKDASAAKAPLLAIEVADTGRFPDKGSLWAWAHVHVSKDIKDGAINDDADPAGISEAVRAAIAASPDQACSRLLSPRHLEADRTYHAFLIPTFESGRLAGLGLDPAKAPSAEHCAWDASGHAERPNLLPTLYPYYFRWEFKTGSGGDFEYLVRQLKPRVVDSRVGVRDVDVQRPGLNMAGIAAPPTLKFSGALRAPRISLTPEELARAQAHDSWFEPFPHPFQQTLAEFINLSERYKEEPADAANGAYADGARTAEGDSGGDVAVPPALPLLDNDPDPVITPPLYGRWHSRTEFLLEASDGSPALNRGNWVHELNLDPRWRGAAGLGTWVIQAQQENLMASAWAQVGALPDANRRIRGGQFAVAVADAWHRRTFTALAAKDPPRALMLTAPLHTRVVLDQRTLWAEVATSTVPEALVGAAMRRAMRPRARLSRTLGFTPADPPQRAVARVASGEIPAVPPKVAPPGIPKIDDSIEALGGLKWPAWLEWLGDRLRAASLWLVLLIAAVLVAAALLVVGLAAIVVVAIGLGALALREAAKKHAVVEDVREERRTPQSVDAMPKSGDFTLVELFSPSFTAATAGPDDSTDATRFKAALRGAYRSEFDAGRDSALPELKPLEIGRSVRTALQAVDPKRTVPLRTLHGIRIPPRLAQPEPEAFDEIMNHPVFDAPMYEPLKEPADNLLPNLHLIPRDSLTLLETNQKFIESYMVGLNHEFARELLWREYPTDQRGSYFRQFWDVSAYYDPNATDPEAQKEELRDIPRIHEWGRDSKLGTHDNREEPGAQREEEVVLTIRGELLKKYPNAVIYAHKAEWPLTEDGRINRTKERHLVPLVGDEETKPPRSKLKTPLYQAKASDDIFLFGFDLTAEQARGGTGDDPGDENRPGWFFVIKERPGEPRFGLDHGDGSKPPEVWTDFAWEHLPAGAPQLSIAQAFQVTKPTDTTQAEFKGRLNQWEDDQHVAWGPDADAAEIAYILYQTPVLVAVHAAEMLPQPKPVVP
jgi:hypothetical protein